MPRELKLSPEQVRQVEDGEGYMVTLPDSVVTEEEIRQNFVPATDHEELKGKVEERVTKAAANAAAKARDEALQDDEFLEAAVKKRREFFEERFPTDGADPEAIRDQFRKEELAPVEEKVATLETENETLRGSAVQGEIDRGMSAGRVTDDHRDLIRDHLRLRARWSEKHRMPVVLDEAGEVRTKVEDGKLRPVTVSEYVQELRTSGKYDFAFQASPKGGGDFKGGDTAGEGDLDAQIAAAEKAGDFGRAGVLKDQKLAQMREKK